MKTLLFIIFKIVLFPLLVSAQVGNLILEDQFNGNTLDNSMWQTVYQWGPVLNDVALEFNLEENVTVENGLLKLQTKNDPGNYNTWTYDANGNIILVPEFFQYTSALIFSKQKFGYGTFEIRCKIPPGGFWPAFWLFGECAEEIDVFEFLDGNPDTITMTVHKEFTCGNRSTHVQKRKEKSKNINYSQNFHTFTLIRTDHEITWLIDGEKANRCEANRCDRCLDTTGVLYPTGNMNVIISVHISPKYLPTTSSGITEVDYIKIWDGVPTCNLFSANDKIISNRTFSNDHEKFISTSITTQNTVKIEAGAVGHWTAGEYIELNPDFEVEEGATFTAEIIPCRPPDDPICKTNSLYDTTSSAGVDAIDSLDTLNTVPNNNNLAEETEDSIIQNNLSQPLNLFPNPFTSITNITYTIMEKQPVTITIKNIMGQEVARPLNNEVQDMGCYKLEVDASGLSHGVYFYTLQTATSSETRKMVKAE